MRDRTIRPPALEEVSERLGMTFTSREVVSDSGISVVERLRSDRSSLILKTSVPELRHEAAVHHLADSLEIGGARLLASNSDAQFPWLVQEDLGEHNSSRLLARDEVGSALEALAEFHVKAANESDAQADVPDRSPQWLVANLDQVANLVEGALKQTEAIDVQRSDIKQFRGGLSALSDATSRMPTTVIHGDFDPGNLAYSRGRWRAIDWGLSHRNSPFADVAHMVMRFPKLEQLPLVERYLEAANQFGADFREERDSWDLLQLGNAAHEAFFVWWHSYCIVRLGVRPETYAASLIQRFKRISHVRQQLGI